MSASRYSTCHFAEVFEDTRLGDKGEPLYRVMRCSFCGDDDPELVPMAHTMQTDLELTLRRWKDGDCSLDDMFERVNTELERSWQVAFDTAAARLQNGKPKYERSGYTPYFHKVEEEQS